MTLLCTACSIGFLCESYGADTDVATASSIIEFGREVSSIVSLPHSSADVFGEAIAFLTAAACSGDSPVHICGGRDARAFECRDPSDSNRPCCDLFSATLSAFSMGGMLAVCGPCRRVSSAASKVESSKCPFNNCGLCCCRLLASSGLGTTSGIVCGAVCVATMPVHEPLEDVPSASSAVSTSPTCLVISHTS